jgi:hypothetical protein
MDSPILNSFLADCFRIVDPIPKDVDWFYIEGDNVVRRFTHTANGGGWRETTESLNTSPDDENPRPSPEGRHFTEFRATNAVHPGYENIILDGLRMHPIARPTPLLELKTFSNEEWDRLDSWFSFESDAETDFRATTAVHPGYENVTPGGLRMHPVTQPTLVLELEMLSNGECDSFDFNEVSWFSFENDDDTMLPCDRVVRSQRGQKLSHANPA